MEFCWGFLMFLACYFNYSRRRGLVEKCYQVVKWRKERKKECDIIHLDSHHCRNGNCKGDCIVKCLSSIWWPRRQHKHSYRWTSPEQKLKSEDSYVGSECKKRKKKKYLHIYLKIHFFSFYGIQHIFYGDFKIKLQ